DRAPLAAPGRTTKRLLPAGERVMPMRREDLSQLYEYAMENYEAGIAEQQAAFARAVRDHDFDGQVRATQEIARLRVQQGEDQRMSNETAHAMNPPPSPQRSPNDVDLTPVDAMKVCGLNPNDPRDVQTYRAGQQKLAYLKSQGLYKE